MEVDLNCDMGESFGRYRVGADEALMPFITSANIACGYHAGDPLVMDRAVRLAAKHKVGVGAHPGFPDLMGFGRRAMQLSPEEIENYILYQVGALAAFARAAGVELIHVKPHGALYNMAAKDVELARAIVHGIARFSKELIVVCLAGSAMIEAAGEVGLRVAQEGFADRAYNPDGTLQSRKEPGSVIHDPQRAAERAVAMVRDGVVVAHTGEEIPLHVDTICVHGDTSTAVQIAQAIRKELEAAGIEVVPMGNFVMETSERLLPYSEVRARLVAKGVLE
ncbi:MAG: LamB/YcsF family protein [Anaerolineae bacterium]|nr:LamB/YcsF family protein [Anaerolineae bacterium]